MPPDTWIFGQEGAVQMQIIGLIHKISTEPYLGIHDGESFLRAQKSRKLLILLVLVAREGIEPPTRGFSVRCSTN